MAVLGLKDQSHTTLAEPPQYPIVSQPAELIGPLGRLQEIERRFLRRRCGLGRHLQTTRRPRLARFRSVPLHVHLQNVTTRRTLVDVLSHALAFTTGQAVREEIAQFRGRATRSLRTHPTGPPGTRRKD